MKFRRLYWAVEQTASNGASTLTGVYTSIPDLIEIGMKWADGIPHRDGFRVSLVQLDVCGAPLGRWTSPEFANMKEELAAFVTSDDFNPQECEGLVDQLRAFCSKVAP
jgi:hypothetical protein